MANLNFLANFMQPRKAPLSALGTGLAGQAAQTMGTSDEYNQYVVDTQMAGETPLSREEWLKQRGTNS